MYSVIGYEIIKAKDGSVFTKVHIVQPIAGGNGYKPFPIPYMVSGEVSNYVPGSPCNLILDQKSDGSLYVSGLTLDNEPGTVIS